MLHLILTNMREDASGYTWLKTMKKKNPMTWPSMQNWKPPEMYLLKSVPVPTNALPETSD